MGCLAPEGYVCGALCPGVGAGGCYNWGGTGYRERDPPDVEAACGQFYASGMLCSELAPLCNDPSRYQCCCSIVQRYPWGGYIEGRSGSVYRGGCSMSRDWRHNLYGDEILIGIYILGSSPCTAADHERCNIVEPKPCCFCDIERGTWCEMLQPDYCVAEGGTTGSGDECTVFSCKVPCCLPNGSCLMLPLPTCEANNGEESHTCCDCGDPDCCDPIPKVCCFCGGDCQVLLPGECEYARWRAYGTIQRM